MRLTTFQRLIIAASALAALGGSAGCRTQPAEEVAVAVIGGHPRLRDPAAGPLGQADALLLASVAQGLVRFDAAGQIEAGLAERWHVSDDGLSYIFRLAAAEWPDGRRVVARDVARLLRRMSAADSRNPLKDALGRIGEIVPMTDRVLEIRLLTPQPHLLELLAQPEFALLFDGGGTGPFTARESRADGSLLLERETASSRDGEPRGKERVSIQGTQAAAAVQRFADDRAQLVLGGTYADLPLAHAARLRRGALRFDPAAGLFGLMPARATGPLADRLLRELLNQAIDRQALVAGLAVPGLQPRATILQPGIMADTDPMPPAWANFPLAERLPQLRTRAEQMFAGAERPLLLVRLGDGSGAQPLLDQLATDWGRLGIGVAAAKPGEPADLVLVDAVAPLLSAAWFLRRFRCEVAPICSIEADKMLAGARAAPVAAQRAALLSEADRLIAEAELFMPLAAPVRWSLVARTVPGFSENIFARHTLVGLTMQPRFGDARSR